MYQVAGAEDVSARHEVHGGAGHIVGVSHPDNIRVGKIRIDHRILILLHNGLPHSVSSENEARLEMPGPR